MIYNNAPDFLQALQHLTIAKEGAISLAKIDETLQKNLQILSDNSIKEQAHDIVASAVSIMDATPQDRSLAFRIFNATSPIVQVTNIAPHWKDSPESKWEILQFHNALLKDPEFTQNFDFVETPENSYSYLGRGREGIVFLARQKENGSLMAIKTRCERDPGVHPYNGKEEVEAVTLFKNATGYPFVAMNFIHFNAKDYIAGKNLQMLLESGEFFEDKAIQSAMLLKLNELLHRLIEAKLFFVDIAPENFIFDGTHFYMIDLRPFEVCTSTAQAHENYKQKILGDPDAPGSISWVQDRWYHPACSKEQKNEFLESIRKILS